MGGKAHGEHFESVLPLIATDARTSGNGSSVPKAVVSAVVMDITHPDTADTIAPPPVDPVSVTVEIRKG